MRSRTKIILAIFTLLFSACSEDWALKEETFTISKENSEWVPTRLDDETFFMIDNSGITQGYQVESEYYYLDKSWGGFLGLNTHMTFTEYRSREYGATYNFDYSISIRASTDEIYGDQIRVQVGNTAFSYDLKQGIIYSLELNFFNQSYLQTTEGFEAEVQIESVCEILDSFVIGEDTYYEVLHFQLHDTPEKWSDYTVTEIYVAKGIGLIKFKLNTDICYTRTYPLN